VVLPDRWLWNYLSPEAQKDSVDFMDARGLDWFPGWGKVFTYYPAYSWMALRAFLRALQERYDLIVAWESKNGFPLALLRRVLGIDCPPLVTLAFAYKGVVSRCTRIGRWVAGGIDHLTVPSRHEVKYYGSLLGIPENRITFCPLGWYDFFTFLSLRGEDEGDYIFAGGRSSRDYSTLLTAAEGVGARLIVNARRFNVRGLKCPPNVHLQGFLPIRDYYALMARARFVVVSLQATPFAAGLSHIVQAMSAGKAVIATRTPCVVDYVEEGRTGILVAPGDPEALRKAIVYLLAHPQEARAMGREARREYEEKYTFDAFAQRTYAILCQVVAAG